MRVFKFGGASVKDAGSIRNMAEIVAAETNDVLVIVVSAMGKTTNALEKVHNSFIKKLPDCHEHLEAVAGYHSDICKELFPDKQQSFTDNLLEDIKELEAITVSQPSFERDYEYDRIVSFGEILSTKIIHSYMVEAGFNVEWIDIRKLLKTDDTFRDAKINFDESSVLLKDYFAKTNKQLFITQGFIGSTPDGKSTTLGREGSDYTAALLAYFLDASDVTIWKDVPGILNADPRIMDDTVRLDEISYREAIELAYYGAQVIHPKTIKPIQNKSIPLFVKSFLNPGNKGSIISNVTEDDFLPPVYIIKPNQVLISIEPKDFSFIAEDNMSLIFAKLAKYRIKANMVENSAIKFSIVADNDESKIHYFIGELSAAFSVTYNQNLELVTVRHYNNEAIKRVTGNRKIFITQLSRKTARYVLR